LLRAIEIEGSEEGATGAQDDLCCLLHKSPLGAETRGEEDGGGEEDDLQAGRQAGSVLDKEKGMEWASNRQPIMTPSSAHHFQQPSSRRRLLPCSFLLRHRQRRTRPEKMILALLFTNSDGNILIERCAPLFRSHSSRYRDPHPRDLASPDEI
jgi:hypothetical protein